MTQRKQYIDKQTITNLSSVVTLTIPSNCDYMELQPKTQNVYLTFDNSTGTATNGFTLLANAIFAHEVHPAAIVKVIEADASASLQVYYYKINEAV